MTEYPIVLERETDGRYSVYAPDLPGCVSWGSTRDEAKVRIREAIELWIESAKEAGEEIPAPKSSLDSVAVSA